MNHKLHFEKINNTSAIFEIIQDVYKSSVRMKEENGNIIE